MIMELYPDLSHLLHASFGCRGCSPPVSFLRTTNSSSGREFRGYFLSILEADSCRLEAEGSAVDLFAYDRGSFLVDNLDLIGLRNVSSPVDDAFNTYRQLMAFYKPFKL